MLFASILCIFDNSVIRKVVVCLQESKVNHVSGSFLRSFGGSFLDKCVFSESTGASGV